MVEISKSASQRSFASSRIWRGLGVGNRPGLLYFSFRHSRRRKHLDADFYEALRLTGSRFASIEFW